MDVLYERCCGLDIHKKTVVACLVVAGAKGKPDKTVRTFGTMTDDIVALADWLSAHQVTHVAMESTGVYWKPIVEHSRGPVRAGLGERPAHQGGAWAQDRCERLRVDGGPVAPWADPGQLCAGSVPAGAAGAHALSDQPDPGPSGRDQGAIRKRGTYAQAQYRRLAGRRGKKRAIVAVAHGLVVSAYHMLNREVDYEDLGATYFDERDRQGSKNRLVKRLELLGYDVDLHDKKQAA